MSDDLTDNERRQRQREAFQKIVEAGQVPPVIPQPPREEPKHAWELSENDKKLMRFLGSGYVPKAAQDSPKKPWHLEPKEAAELRKNGIDPDR